MNVLVDTSVWIEHFRNSQPNLVQLLDSELVVVHPFVAGELACGNLKDRTKVLRHINALPRVGMATHAEVIHLIEAQKLWGTGLGWVDLNLLASARLAGCLLWSFDKRLAKTAEDLDAGYTKWKN